MNIFQKISPLPALIVLCILLFHSSCGTRGDNMSALEERADTCLHEMTMYLERGRIDSLHTVTENEDGLIFFIYEGGEPAYWSDNRLNTDTFVWPAQDTWTAVNFKNAEGLCKWTKWGGLRLLAVIPQSWRTVDEDTLARSFSYRPLIKQKTEDTSAASSRARTHALFIIIIALFAAVAGVGVWGVVRARGFRHMRLQTRLQYIIVPLVLAGFLYIFWMSAEYVKSRYAMRQQTNLRDKSLYLQAALQDLYYWDIDLAGNTAPLNIDLRTLAFTYGVDIHVYDMSGRVAGSSTPQLFEEGYLSPYVAPDAVFSKEAAFTKFEQLGDVRYLTSYTAFLNGQNVQIGYIAVPSFPSEDEMAMEVDNFLLRLLPAYLIVLLLAVCLSVFVSRSLVAPLRRLSEKMSGYSFGKSDNHIQYEYNDEVGELVSHYNAMVDSLDEAGRKLAQSERDSAWRTMARQIAHEIKNPLTPMKLTIQQLQRTKGTARFDDYFDRSTRVLLEQMDSLSRIASSFSTFAQIPDVEVSDVDIAGKLSSAIALFAHNDNNTAVRYIGPDSGVTARADREQITEVFTNILKNALQALEGQADGEVIVVLQDGAEEVCISFSDNGPGIAPDIRDRIFMPNFTTKSTGTGLGLAISKNIVEGSGGKISFETSEKGTKFLVCLKKKQ